MSIRTIQESADLINQLILQASTSAIGKTSGSGSFGQLISVDFEGIGSKQAICAGDVTPGFVQGWLTDRGWIVQSSNQASLVRSVRNLRRGREVDTGLLSFAFLYSIENQLFLGGLFPRKLIDLDNEQESMMAGSIHHRGQKYLAIAKISESKLLVLEKGKPPFIFEDSRVSVLSPKGGGVWTGFKRTEGSLTESSSQSETVKRSVIEVGRNIDPLDQGVKFLEVNGVASYYLQGGNPDLNEGLYIIGIWYSKAIRIDPVDPPELGIGLPPYFVTRRGIYYDYLTTTITKTKYEALKISQVEHYLFSGNAISVGSGTETFRINSESEGSSTADNRGFLKRETTGSGLIYLLPDLPLAWSKSQIFTEASDSQTGTIRDSIDTGEEYSLPYLINNAADRVIALWSKTYFRVQSFPTTGQPSIITRQEQIELRQINKSEPDKPIVLNSKPIFALQRIGNAPLLPVVGEMTIAVNGAFTASFAADLPGMAIVYAVKQDTKNFRGIGVINSLLLAGGTVQGMSVSITTVVRDGYDRLATEQGTIYSNNGSFLGLFNSNPNIVLEAISVGQVGFTKTTWVKDVIYITDTDPAKRSNFISSGKHFAEVWKIDYQAQPAQVFRQSRSIEANKAKLGLLSDNSNLDKVAGSYFQ